MKRFWIVVLILLTFYYLADFGINSVKNGNFEKYLDSHPGSLNPRIEYYLAVTLNLADKDNRAMHWYEKVYKGYPESEWAPLAWAENIELLQDKVSRKEIEEEANKFLERYPEHPKAEILRRKIQIMKNV